MAKKRQKRRNAVGYCKFHDCELTSVDVKTKKCGLTKLENGEYKYTGELCPHLVATNKDWWTAYEVIRARRYCGKNIKRIEKRKGSISNDNTNNEST